MGSWQALIIGNFSLSSSWNSFCQPQKRWIFLSLFAIGSDSWTKGGKKWWLFMSCALSAALDCLHFSFALLSRSNVTSGPWVEMQFFFRLHLHSISDARRNNFFFVCVTLFCWSRLRSSRIEQSNYDQSGPLFSFRFVCVSLSLSLAPWQMSPSGNCGYPVTQWVTPNMTRSFPSHLIEINFSTHIPTLGNEKRKERERERLKKLADFESHITDPTTRLH